MGHIEGHWLSEEQKLEILIMIEQAKEKGFSATRNCIFWRINRRRVLRWRMKRQSGQSLRNLKPGPRAPVQRLLPEETAAVLQMAKKEEYADLFVCFYMRNLFLCARISAKPVVKPILCEDR